MTDHPDAFERVLAFTINQETGGDQGGGFTEDPKDPGGATRWGISKRAHPDIDPRALTYDEATEVYRDDYWANTSGKLEGGEDSASLEAALFDFAVHSGAGRAVKKLQRIVGTRVDGDLGPATRAAIARYKDDALARELTKHRKLYLMRLTAKRPDLERFRSGWRARTATLIRAIKAGQFRSG